MGKIGKIGKIGRRGWGLMIFFARATRGLRRPSLEARSGSPSRPPSREGKTSKLGGNYFNVENVRSLRRRTNGVRPL